MILKLIGIIVIASLLGLSLILVTKITKLEQKINEEKRFKQQTQSESGEAMSNEI
jgi:uncharacterized membrane protein